MPVLATGQSIAVTSRLCRICVRLPDLPFTRSVLRKLHGTSEPHSSVSPHSYASELLRVSEIFARGERGSSSIGADLSLVHPVNGK